MTLAEPQPLPRPTLYSNPTSSARTAAAQAIEVGPRPRVAPEWETTRRWISPLPEHRHLASAAVVRARLDPAGLVLDGTSDLAVAEALHTGQLDTDVGAALLGVSPRRDVEIVRSCLVIDLRWIPYTRTLIRTTSARSVFVFAWYDDERGAPYAVGLFHPTVEFFDDAPTRAAAVHDLGPTGPRTLELS